MAKQANQPLVSIILPVHGVNSCGFKRLDDILEQTYRNIEVILVGNDIKDNATIVECQKNNHNIKIVELGSDKGLFRARLQGFQAASGDFLLSVDGNDGISIDYVRTLIMKAQENNSDIVIPEMVMENGSEKFVYNFANDLPFESLNGDQCHDKFFEQQGENFAWYQIAGPLFSRKVIDRALVFLDTITEKITCSENIIFSMVIWCFAERVDRAQTAYCYQYEKSNKSQLDFELLKNNIRDVGIVFDTIKDFLKSKDLYAVYEKDLIEWMNLYSQEYHHHINKLLASDEQKKGLSQSIQFGNEEWSKKTPSRFYSVKTKFNDGLENLKHKIISDEVEVVSFDIFDTLVTRPFLIPSDLFYLLDRDFKNLEDRFRLQSFRDIRIESENIARSENNDSEDVSLEQIYGVLQREFFVEKNVADKMLGKELELEIRYCSQRRTAKELYDLAIFIGKKVIISSDMYLPIKTLSDILENCNYKGYEKLYVSSHHGVMKATTNLYKHIASDLGVAPGLILHIGDNYDSDVTSAISAGCKAVHFSKTTEVSPEIFNNIFTEDNLYARSHLGVTAAYAVASNKYFDNPFRSFLRESNYNCSPYFMGYFALGLAMLGFTKWMTDDVKKKGVESIVFLGRDGYLPMQIFDIFKQKYHLEISSHYLPTSRKATIPLALFSSANISDIKTFNYLGHITDSIERSLKPYIKDGLDDDIKNIDFRKIQNLQSAFTNTYRNFFNGRTAVMDIGYSGRPQQILSKLFNVPIETYFMYTGRDEARRRLGDTVNIYGRLRAAAIREKLISEIGPSCIGYGVQENSVVPIFETTFNISYYETYFLSSTQRGAMDFTQDYLSLFQDFLNDMNLGDNNLAMQPLDKATVAPALNDIEMYRGVMHEDSIALDGSINIFDQYCGKNKDVDNILVLEENSQLGAELESYMSIKRSAKLLAGNIKRRIKYGKKR